MQRCLCSLRILSPSSRYGTARHAQHEFVRAARDPEHARRARLGLVDEPWQIAIDRPGSLDGLQLIPAPSVLGALRRGEVRIELHALGTQLS